MSLLPRSLDLPVFPWDLLAPFSRLAQSHPGGIVDLSVGTPVDETPRQLQKILCENSNSPGYPTVLGSKELREAIVTWTQKSRRITGLDIDSCFPTVGSKELVANLGWQLGLKPGDKVLFPEVAYPTYEICARLAGAIPVPVSTEISSWPKDAALVWLNTPANPHGWVASEDYLKKVVSWARKNQAIVVSDECYAELNWEIDWVPSLLSDSICGGNHQNLLMVYSLSKQSNLAGYRAAFVAGDRELIHHLVAVRKHAGFMVPSPVQRVLQGALADTEHVAIQKARYHYRRQKLVQVCQCIGLENHPESVAGLYLWLRAGENISSRFMAQLPAEFAGKTADWQLLYSFAKNGILVAPESFYSRDPKGYVRMALTATDVQIEAACERLSKFI